MRVAQVPPGAGQTCVIIVSNTELIVLSSSFNPLHTFFPGVWLTLGVKMKRSVQLVAVHITRLRSGWSWRSRHLRLASEIK